jgi:alkanesulfonate monooxygenase SsuD/methylene tetrahydromethanopterin reductase-like flavin-dependent oxidoreductase (luciferase family)
MMQFGLIVQTTGLLGYPQPLAHLARLAEAAGWDGFFIWDIFGGDPAAPAPTVDPWIALAAIAATTERIRFGPMVTPLPRRRPWKLAREAASLDQLSGGRLILGVGIGTPPEEFARFGEEPDSRIRAEMLDEGLEVLTGLWSGEPFSFQERRTVLIPGPALSGGRGDTAAAPPPAAAHPDLGWWNLAAQAALSPGGPLGWRVPRRPAREPHPR